MKGGKGVKVKRMDLIWAASLVVIGISVIVLAGSNLAGIELPDAVTRIIGLIALIELPVLAFTSVKKLKENKKL